MPRKEFQSFTRLDASDVNTYLMDQSVQTFAGTAARGSAITEPVEGMVTYLNDIDSLSIYNGTEFVENRPIQVFAGTAARGSALPTPKEGMVTYLNDINSLSVYNGTAFTTDRTIQVFAGTAARGSAIGTAVEGMYTHINDTDSLEYYDGSAWVAAGGGSNAGLTLINTTDFSAVASQSVNDVFSATYDNYKILVDFTDSSLDCEVTMRLRVAGVDASSAVYSNRYLHRNTEVNNDSQTSFRWIMELDGATNGHYYSTSMDVKSPFKVEQTIISLSGLLLSSLAAPYLEVGSAIHDANTSYDGFTLLASSGTMTGVVSVYGYSK